MRLRTLFATIAIFTLCTTVAFADSPFQVKPNEFDPGKTFLVQAAWLEGIGCPTNAKIAIPNADFSGIASFGTYSDPACATGGDSKDKRTEGLLLVKTGPTLTNFAAAGAKLEGVKGMTLTELGYDIRKPGASTSDPRGSQCDADSPRFNITTTTGFYFLACNSPPPDSATAGAGWMRLRWGNGSAGSVLASLNGQTLQPVTGEVKSIEIVFDEGQDFGPTNFGEAVLDNIDVNGTLVGRGPTDAD
jgi:hypothetical protein